ncbi:hypothetical protein HGRIS_011274 [Hohenbuehelia grisea]|uniref:Uncharacterized protein n=1 Tax=Hohenbuehelia grisea TaxID=104357 RepID=A0ABR3JUM4_9AGAR
MKSVLDENLVHTVMHESVVCYVRFSADGKYLATGCNRTAQIFDTKTGMKTCVLADEAAAKARDLYIRSVCFSPDGSSSLQAQRISRFEYVPESLHFPPIPIIDLLTPRFLPFYR